MKTRKGDKMTRYEKNMKMADGWTLAAIKAAALGYETMAAINRLRSRYWIKKARSLSLADGNKATA